jgi:hypothetical protein
MSGIGDVPEGALEKSRFNRVGDSSGSIWEADSVMPNRYRFLQD